jgi:hypothetical protein
VYDWLSPTVSNRIFRAIERASITGHGGTPNVAYTTSARRMLIEKAEKLYETSLAKMYAPTKESRPRDTGLVSSLMVSAMRTY